MTEVEKRITRSRIRLINGNPFFGFLCLFLEMRECDQTPTMGTDGRYCFYNPRYVQTLTDDELVGLIAHEIYHCAFGHLWRRGEREPLKWNVAADAVTNAHLMQHGFILPKDGIKFPDAANMSVEEVYQLLQARQDLKGKVIDDHGLWKAGNGNGSSGNGNKNGGKGNGVSEKELEGMWKEKAIQAAAIAKQQGIGLGGIEQELEAFVNPKLPWRTILYNYILNTARNNYRLIPPNKKHMWRDIYLPSVYGEEIRIVFAIDTSGSMTDEDIAEAFGLLMDCCQQFDAFRVHLYQCDYGIQEYREITDMIPEFPKKVLGRGGTSFVPVFQDIERRQLDVSCIVYFTDLEGTFPSSPPQYPVIWLATTLREVPFGEVIRYRSERK